jgi:hypothetical protein
MTEDQPRGALTLEELDARLAELELQEASTKRSLAMATDGFKKCRKRSGAAAYKRSWYFEEQMKRFEAQLKLLSEEQALLKAERARRIAD